MYLSLHFLLFNLLQQVRDYIHVSSNRAQKMEVSMSVDEGDGHTCVAE